MAKTTPHIRNGILAIQEGTQKHTVLLESGPWWDWLNAESQRTFYFENALGGFTARREYKHGGWYWYTYRKHGDKLHKAYLGKSEALTLEKLNTTAATLGALQTEKLALLDTQQEDQQVSEQQPREAVGNLLLMTKLSIPPARTGLIDRPRLIDQLARSLHHKLTLISAQAGFGKTSLLSQWVQESGMPVTWISLDEADNDPVRFWSYITSVTSLTQLPNVPGTPTPTTQQLITLYSTGAYQQNPQLAQFVSTTAANDTTLITVQSDTKPESNEGNALIDSLRASDQAAGQGLTVLVGGFQAITLDFDRYLYSRFPEAIVFILIATYILLLLMFRSVLLPLKAILMNVLSISVAYGVLVYVFQWGHLQHLLGFTSEGFVESTLPITMFCVLFGLSMDYEVFLLSRIREEWLRTSNNRYAVARGLEKTGSVITNAALLFAIVAGAITFTSLISTKEVGLGMTVAVLVDATIIRSLLVPATMRLLGRWNWWFPGRALPDKEVEAEVVG